MWPFRQKTQHCEQLHDQIAQNELIQGWFAIDTGELGWLVVDASARSAEEETMLRGKQILSLIACVIVGFVGTEHLGNAGLTASGLFLIGMVCVVWPLWLWRINLANTGHRLLSISTTDVQVELTKKRNSSSFKLDQIVGVTLAEIDAQKQDEERRKAFKNHNRRSKEPPKLLQPHSRRIDLQTDLGTVPLGAIYGLEKAEAVANAINTALAYMKGRSGSGKQPAVDPRFQYGAKQAGRIPD